MAGLTPRLASPVFSSAVPSFSDIDAPVKYLCIDLSSKRGSVSLGNDEVPLPQDFQHCEGIIPAIRSLIEDISSVDMFQTTLGPGSFTGLRIALSTLKAFSLVHSTPIQTFHSAEIRALSWIRENPKEEKIEIVTQLAQRSFLVSSFEKNGQILRHLGDNLFDSKPDHGIHDFDCHASLLFQEGALAQIKNIYSTPLEVSALSPLYFGAKRFSET